MDTPPRRAACDGFTHVGRADKQGREGKGGCVGGGGGGGGGQRAVGESTGTRDLLQAPQNPTWWPIRFDGVAHPVHIPKKLMCLSAVSLPIMRL